METNHSQLRRALRSPYRVHAFLTKTRDGTQFAKIDGRGLLFLFQLMLFHLMPIAVSLKNASDNMENKCNNTCSRRSDIGAPETRHLPVYSFCGHLIAINGHQIAN